MEELALSLVCCAVASVREIHPLPSLLHVPLAVGRRVGQTGVMRARELALPLTSVCSQENRKIRSFPLPEEHSKAGLGGDCAGEPALRRAAPAPCQLKHLGKLARVFCWKACPGGEG